MGFCQIHSESKPSKMTYPTQSTPGGCFIAVTAMFPAAVAMLGFWGLVKWVQLPVEIRHFDSRFWMLAGAAGIGSLIAIGILMLSARILRSTDFRGYDSRDPDRTNLKW